MGFFRWIREHIAEGLLFCLIMMMAPFVIVGFVMPGIVRMVIVGLSLIFISIIFLIVLILALRNRLQFRMGIRNLIRHKTDTVIAILGFMIGTSIICSSLAIGDTMGNMIESLVYDSYYLTDEYVTVTDEVGEPYIFNGSDAMTMSDMIWAINEEEGERLIDGVSWEYMEYGAIINLDTELFEPVVSLRAFSEHTEGAFGGISSGGIDTDYQLEPDEIFITESVADLVDGEAGHKFTISSGERVHQFTVKAVIENTGRMNFFYNTILMSYSALYDLFNVTGYETLDYGLEGNWEGGFYNYLMISNEGDKVEGGELCPRVIEEVEERFEILEHPVDSSQNIEVTDDKKTSVDGAISAMSMFSTMFLALGTFSIIAGITLILNIFVMLAEERKGEMGISRAVGMKKRHLRLMYLFEGTVYSLVSSAVGVVLGVITGYLIILGVQSIFQSFGEGSFTILEYYSVTPMSLILAFIGGFSITIGTTILITQTIANLNIVSAIRNTPVPKTKFKLIIAMWKLFNVWDEHNLDSDGSKLAKVLDFFFDKLVVAGFMISVLSFLFLAIGFNFEVVWGVMLGASLLMIGIGLVIRYFLSERLTFNITAILILAIWITPSPEFMKDYYAELEMFVLSGVFMVTAGVLLLVWNSDILIEIIERIVYLIRIPPAPIKMAISYPMKKRFRTGVTIFMFALIIFTITGMSMIVHTFNVNINAFEKNLGGGYDIIGISQVSEISDIEASLQDADVHSYIDWEETVSLSTGALIVNLTLPMGFGHREAATASFGVSERFIDHNDYGFDEVAWDLVDPDGTVEHTDRNVWNTLKLSGDYVILDSSFGSSSFMAMGSGLAAGDEIVLKSINGTYNNKTVLGISSLLGYSGVFQYEEYAAGDFNTVEKTMHLIKVKEGYDRRDVANDMRKELVNYGFYAIVVRELIEQFLEVQNSFFDLFNAFLALGLIIGIVGLGIVTLRSVYERRHEIGMMRAIGFKRKAVVLSFLGESAFIAGSGLTVGTVLGIILGWMLWRDGLKEAMPEFGVPWLKLLSIVGIAFFFALIASIPPSYSASKVTPAEALRYE